MVQIEYGQPPSEFCENFERKHQLVYPLSSLILLQPEIQHFVSSNLLSQPGDHNFVSNSISVQQHSAPNQQLFDNIYPTQQVIIYGPVLKSVPLPSNTATRADVCQQAGPSPDMTIIGDITRSPPMLVCTLPLAGPSPEPLRTPVKLQTIQLVGDGQVRLIPAPAPVIPSIVYNDTNSTVNYLVQPGDLKHSAPIVQASRQHNSADPRKGHSHKKGSFSEETISILKSWLFRNITHPYPTEVEKKELLCLTGLTLSQLNNWLINSRRRMLKRLLSTLEGDHANFNSRASKGTSGVNSRYANIWKNEGVGEQANIVHVPRDESEDGVEMNRLYKN